MHDGRILEDSSSERHAISTNTTKRRGGVVTISTLTINGVSGFDSSPVMCTVMYSDAGSAEINSISSDPAVLAVLGEWWHSCQQSWQMDSSQKTNHHKLRSFMCPPK